MNFGAPPKPPTNSKTQSSRPDRTKEKRVGNNPAMATKFNVIAIGAASAALSVATVLLASSIFVKNDASLADDGEER